MSNVMEELNKSRIIVIVRGADIDTLIPLADALIEGGVRMMEITYNASDETSDKTVAENILALASHTGGRMLIGAGTVTRPGQVDLTLAAGGKFIISPDTNPYVIDRTKALGLTSIPGALTPTEIATAHRLGADVVKLFPINVMGAGYLAAIKAPLSHIPIIAVGSVTEENIPEYLKAGAAGFGIGTKFGDPSLLRDKRFDKITEVARRYTKVAGKRV